ncbi:MAG TPA: RNA polymerase sigma factor, partial [Phycisphaerae bacterium]|nr:RNA polymerase sigma factor [Phycisphaerae bacterium]
AFLAWLRTIAENKLIDVRRGLLAEKRDVRRNVARSAGAGQSYSDLVDRVAAISSTPSRRVARQEAVAITLVQMAQLPDDYRRVIQWRVIQGLSVQEVARLLNRSEDAVHMLCYRALKKLGELMGEPSAYLPDA